MPDAAGINPYLLDFPDFLVQGRRSSIKVFRVSVCALRSHTLCTDLGLVAKRYFVDRGKVYNKDAALHAVLVSLA
jgi:hypothetical protein